MRYMLNQSKVKMIAQANKRHQAISNIGKGAKEMELAHAKMKQGLENVHGDGPIMNLENSRDLGQYEDQYNANHDFAIFQVGNDAVGGLMNLEQK